MSNPHSGENQAPEPVLDKARQHKARQYAALKRRLSLADLAIIGGLLLWCIFSGHSKEVAGLINWPAVPAAVLYLVILMLAYGLLTLPLSYYRSYVLPRRYGLSTQNLSGWLGDSLKAASLGLGLAAAIIAVIYWFLSTWPEVWWLLGWGLVVVISLVLTVLAPLLIVPLFFATKPLADAELKERLEKLAGRAGTKIGGIYEAEFSSKGTTANAALMGLGRTRRVVLSDTLLEQYSAAEIEVVMAHELGHHKNGDFSRLFLWQAAILLASFLFTDIIIKAAVTPLGYSGIDDIAALPLLVIVFAVLNLLLTPVSNAYIRSRERAADDFALRLTGNRQAFITMMTRLTDQNLEEARPARWVERLLYDHPSCASRVAHASSISLPDKGQGDG